MFDESRLYPASEPALMAIAPYSTMAHWRSEGRGPAYLKYGGRVMYKVSTKIRGVKRRDGLPSKGRVGVRGRRLDVQPSMSVIFDPTDFGAPKPSEFYPSDKGDATKRTGAANYRAPGT